MARRNDLKAKEKRQKIIAAAGAVILLGVLAIQVPRTLKMLNPPKAEETAAPAPSATPPPGSSVPLAPPTTAGGAPTPAGTADGGLADSDPAPLPSQSQLLGFSRFTGKDPFAEQVKTEGGVAVADSQSKPKAPPPKPTGSSSTGVVSQPSTVPSAPSAPSAPPTVAKPTSATISVNGVAEAVSIGAEFPQAQPIFRLVALTRNAAKIAIAGGSLASGEPNLTLRLGKTVTLMNTADGTRYEIRLVALG